MWIFFNFKEIASPTNSEKIEENPRLSDASQNGLGRNFMVTPCETRGYKPLDLYSEAIQPHTGESKTHKIIFFFMNA